MCEGGGMRVIEMNFLPDVYVHCEKCNGKRYNRETLEIRYKGKSISDVLNMTVDEAVEFFSAVPYIYRKINFDVPYNWKLVQENFSEAYHTKFIHPNTLEPLIQTKAWAVHLLANGHAATAVKSRGSLTNLWASDVDGDAAQSRLNEVTRKSQRNCNIFPNVTLSPAEKIFPLIIVWPVSVAHSRLEIYFLKMEKAGQGAGTAGDEATVEGLKTVLAEDFKALNGIQAAISGGGIDAVRLGWEEQIIYNHHRQIDRLIGHDIIPQGLCVEDIELPIDPICL